MIYSNGPERVLELPESAPLMRPLIQRDDEDVAPGTRKYIIADYSAPDVQLFVTLLGHWYLFGSSVDTDADGNWVCRGCRVVGETGKQMDRLHGRCPRPPEGQDVTSALLGRSVVAA